jgi:hypothetical protein
MIRPCSTETIRQSTITRCAHNQNLDCFIVQALTHGRIFRQLFHSLAIVRALKMCSHVLNLVQAPQYDPSRPHLFELVEPSSDLNGTDRLFIHGNTPTNRPQLTYLSFQANSRHVAALQHPRTADCPPGLALGRGSNIGPRAMVALHPRAMTKPRRHVES